MQPRRFSASRRFAPVFALFVGLTLTAACHAADAPTDAEKARIQTLIKTGQRLDHACDKAVDWLVHQQNADGSYGRDPRSGKAYPSVGLTAMALKAIMSIPHQYHPQDGPFVTKPGDWMISVQKDSGAIVAADEKNANYETSVAIMALAKLKAFDDKTYTKAIDKAAGYIKGCQYATVENDPKSGGVGYRAGDTNVDLPNTQMFLDALHAAGYAKDSKEYQNAVNFLARCQASAETNKLDWAKDQKDGGGRYNEKGLTQDKAGVSTGGLSYSLLSSYLTVELPVTDPRTSAVLNYISGHYNTDEHPGLGADGLFYYYVMMAQSLDQYSHATGGSYQVKTTDGATHTWSVELGQKLMALQAQDGSFTNTKSGKYWENDPVLCTAYSMIAMGTVFHNIEAELKSMNIELEEDD